MSAVEARASGRARSPVRELAREIGRPPTERVDPRPLLAVALAGALALATVLALQEHFWETNALLPVLQVVIALAALQTGFLLWALSGRTELAHVRLTVVGFAAIAAGAAWRAALLPSTAGEAVGPLGGRPTTAMALAVVGQLVLAATVLGGGLGLRWRRLPYVIGGVAAVAMTLALVDRPRLPVLVRADGSLTGAFVTAALVLALVVGAGLVVWVRATGPRPRLVELWLTVSVGLGGWSLVLRALAGERFTGLWWSATAFELLQVLVPAIGIHLGLLRLYEAVAAYEPSLRRRLTGELERLLSQVDAAPERLAPGRVDGAVRAVLRDRALVPAYQPIVDLDLRSIVAVEALARFPQAPDRPVPEWFADARASGLGPDLELLAVGRALEVIEGAGGLPGAVSVTVNASPEVVCSDAFHALVAAGPADRLIVEVTEHAVVDDYEELQDALERLRALGVRVAVDDAGAGFSSLRHVVQLRPDVIKLDRSLLTDLDTDPTHRALATTLVEFARRVGADLVAEGVETAPQAALLRRLGIRYVQGFHFVRPGPLAEVLAALPVLGTSARRHAVGGHESPRFGHGRR